MSQHVLSTFRYNGLAVEIDPGVFQPQMVVYAKRAVDWDSVDPALPTFEEMPPPEAMEEVLS